MMDASDVDVWFLTGSQSLYGREALGIVEAQSSTIVRGTRTPTTSFSKPGFAPGSSRTQPSARPWIGPR